MSQVIFTIVALLCLYLFVRAIRIWQVTLLWLGWAIVVSAATITGLFQLDPITFAPVLLATFICCVFTCRLIQNCQLAIKMLYAIHILRIVVELVLFKLYSAGKVPIEMTFTGWNMDIIFGLSALSLLIWMGKSTDTIPKRLLQLWNLLGLCSVLWILLIGILSSPLPLQQMAFDRPNIAVLEFPFCLLPTLVVPLVILAHLIEIRRIKLKN